MLERNNNKKEGKMFKTQNAKPEGNTCLPAGRVRASDSRSHKGFTLIELIIVLIIVAVLGTLGLTQYTRLIEKARGAEAKEIIGSIRKMAAAHYMQYDTMIAPSLLAESMVNIGGAGGVPGAACAPTHYFRYGIVPALNSISITATRCTAGGKAPQGPAPAASLTLATSYSGGTDVWTGGVYE
jgi:prepilin-type N-terminal cleavage/methylation domain-containing protein